MSRRKSRKRRKGKLIRRKNKGGVEQKERWW